MLKEMSNSIILLCFKSAASINPKTNLQLYNNDLLRDITEPL